MWRKHQREVIDICNEIIEGKPINKVYIDAHPGSGKSGDSVLFAKHLIGNGFDKICHVAPRLSLCYQIEESMLDPFFDSGKVIRASDNLENPSRNLDGFAITFQSICSNSKNLIEDFKKNNYILVMDECHHSLEGGEFAKPLVELVELSKLTVFMTGTSFRNNGDKIEFFPYKDNQLDKTESENVEWVTYTRRDALNEEAILPVKINLVDGSGSYTKGLKTIEYDTITKEHIKAAVKSDYAFQVIDHDMAEFIEYKKSNPKAQMILVGTDIQTSRKYAEYICEKWMYCEAVDSQMKDSPEIIRRFRKGKFDVLSSCSQAYEGLDAPDTSHMIILTHIRSEPWLIQCINRCTRAKQGKDFGYITAPADPDFQIFFKNWIWEQERYLEEKEERGGGNGSGGGPKPDLNILSGEAHLPPSVQEKTVREQLNHRINVYISEQSTKIINGKKTFVHTESMRRRQILWMQIYIKIGRKCQLKEMTMPEMDLALNLIIDLTSQ
jgi:superfamily II DNA or RNA helicase